VTAVGGAPAREATTNHSDTSEFSDDRAPGPGCRAVLRTHVLQSAVGRPSPVAVREKDRQLRDALRAAGAGQRRTSLPSPSSPPRCTPSPVSTTAATPSAKPATTYANSSSTDPAEPARYHVGAPAARTIAALLILRDQVIAPILAAVRSPRMEHTNPRTGPASTVTTNESASICKRSSTISPSKCR
jgi:hypothetical protein